MNTALKEGLKDKPELLLQAIESEDDILYYFKMVLNITILKKYHPTQLYFIYLLNMLKLK